MRRIIYFWIFICISGALQAQDPAFTQFFQNPIYYNPALSAAGEGMTFRSNYRNFWRQMDHGKNTIDFTMDSQEDFLSGGLGFILMSGVEGNGIIKDRMAGLSYGYNMLVIARRLDIQMGLQAAFVQKSFQTNNLIFSDQIDPLYGITQTSQYSSIGNDKVIYPDFASGINFRFNLGKIISNQAFATLNVGYAMHHLTQPNESFTGLVSRVPIKHVAYLSSIINFTYNHNKHIYLSPAVIYEQQSIFKTFVAGANISYNPIFVGVWVRNHGIEFNSNSFNSVALSAGLWIDSRDGYAMQIGYSYDINVSKTQNLLGDAHEISVRVSLKDVGLFNNTHHVSRKARQNRACFNKF